jgi:aminoglycoside phosphotransferase (APT) family kinase protein
MQRLSRLPAVRPLMPAVLAVHPEHRLLVTEGVVAGVPLDRARLERGGSDPERAAALGAALAAIHRSTPDGLGVVDHAGPMQRNWSRLTPRSVTLFPAGYREIAVRVQAGDYLDQLGELATGWRADTLVHGDVKSDNVLCHPDDAASLRLIDWECTGRGDARWDVGSAVGDYLAGWLRTMHVTPDRGLAGWIESATPSLPLLREELAALLAAYRAGRPGVGDDDVAGWMRYAGMFLLHRLTVAAMQSVEVASHSLAVLQVSRQLVRSPHTAMEVLLP